MTQILNLLFFDVAIEKQGGVLLLCLLFLVDALQVLYQVINLRDV